MQKLMSPGSLDTQPTGYYEKETGKHIIEYVCKIYVRIYLSPGMIINKKKWITTYQQ